MRGQRLDTQGQQVAPLASKLPLWSRKTPKVVLIKGTVPLQQNKGSRISRVVIHRGESLKKKNLLLTDLGDCGGGG